MKGGNLTKMLRLPLGNNQPEIRNLFLTAGIFLVPVLALSLNRYFSFYATYDHGLFNQLFWNNLHGHFFQSSLTGGNSAGALLQDKVPTVSFLHLGQHFVLDFLLWLPIYALFPFPATLVVLQVGLITAGGLVLYALARHYLQPNLSLMITASYYGACAVLGPTFANFYEQCQIPLFAFGLLLALEKQRWWIFWILVVLVLGIREDAGFITFSIGLYLLCSRRYFYVGIVLCLLSFVYVTAVTNVIMPHFSDDNSRLYLASRFDRLVEGNPNPSTLQILWAMLTHPREVVVSLLTPFDKRFFYLIEHWLPLAFIPAISPAAWITAGVPLLVILLQSGDTAFMISVRYALSVVPGLFYGAVLWWSAHKRQFKPRCRRFWALCIALSIVFSIVSNPNRAFYFLIPESFTPWSLVSLPQQWEHVRQIRQVIGQIPADASVSATTYLIPSLSSRREIFRLPALKLQNDQGQIERVDYIAADVWQLLQGHHIFRFDMVRLQAAIPVLDQVLANATYGVVAVQDGVVLMRKGAPSQPDALKIWTHTRQEVAWRWQKR